MKKNYTDVSKHVFAPRLMAALLVAIALFAIPTLGHAQGEDLCDDGFELECDDSDVSTTVGATVDGAGLCGAPETGPGVWYMMVGDGSCVTVSTCHPETDFDTKLSIFTGDCGALVCVAGNDDYCGFDGTKAEVTFATVDGDDYFIQVHGNGTGNYKLSITCFDDFICAYAPTTMRSQFDGITLGSLSQVIKNENVGAGRYRWKFIEADGTAHVGYNNARYPSLARMLPAYVPGLPYNTTFEVRVAPLFGFDWGTYGPSTTITTPAIPSGTLEGADCGTTVSSLNQYLEYTYIPGADRYRIRAVGPGVGDDTIYSPFSNPTFRRFYMGQFNGVTCGSSYTITVSAFVNGSWTAFGAPCSVTTPSCKQSSDQLTNEELAERVSLVAFPNPSSGVINIALPGLAAGEHLIDLNVYDLTGRRVWNRRMVSAEGEYIAQINVNGDFADGVYLLVASVDGTTFHQKLVID